MLVKENYLFLARFNTMQFLAFSNSGGTSFKLLWLRSYKNKKKIILVIFCLMYFKNTYFSSTTGTSAFLLRTLSITTAQNKVTETHWDKIMYTMGLMEKCTTTWRSSRLKTSWGIPSSTSLLCLQFKVRRALRLANSSPRFSTLFLVILKCSCNQKTMKIYSFVTNLLLQYICN